MLYRTLGRTGLSVSEIGLGCSGFWGDKRFPDEKAADVVRAAWDCGINFFDTGSNYSNFNAEPRLGRSLKPLLASGVRDRIVISTKAGSTAGYAPHVEDNDMTFTDFSPSAIEASCLKSIQNLDCGWIDVFQLHGLNKAAFGNELFDCLLSLKERGLVKHIGINTHFHDEFLEVLKYPEIFEMVLLDCNVLQLDRYEDIARLSAAGMGVAVGTVLGQGHLIRKAKIGSFRDGSFFWYFLRTMIKPTTRAFQQNARRMREVLTSIPEMTAAQAAFAYLLENPDISSCMFGTTSIRNLEEVAAASGRKLTEESRRRIADAYAAGPTLSR